MGYERATPLTVLTQSSLTTFCRCEEKYRLRYIEGLRQPGTRAPLRMGSAFHRGIEHRSADVAEDYLRGLRGPQWSEAEQDVLETEVTICRAMVAGALRRWTVWPTRQNTERAFLLRLRNPESGRPSTKHALAGVLDGLWLGDDVLDQGPTLMELKSASQTNDTYFLRLELDFQLSAYMEAASLLLGRPVRRCIYRVVRKPGIRPKKGETLAEFDQRCLDRKPLALLKQKTGESGLYYAGRMEAREADRKPLNRKLPEEPESYRERVRALYTEQADDYFHEVVVTRSEQQMERWRWEAWSLHQRILAVERGQMTIRNDRSCTDFGRCDYLDLCAGQVGPEAYDVADSPHPELPSADAGLEL